MIELTQAEWQAVDSPVFQRLRSIRQLAMTHLVYPGAVHTRFEHSIGVRSVAGQLAASPKLGLTQGEKTVVQTAALLHDCGHGPFSHVSEQVIDAASGVHGVHEAVSVFLMRNDADLQQAFGEDLLNEAAAIVGLEVPRSAIRDIVSGPTDADKLDYLLRDSYFAGVKYGEFDLGKLIESVRVIAPGAAQTQLGFEVDGVWAVEGLLMARHHMHRQVYGHKTRLATDIMISRALSLGIEEGILPANAYRVDVSEVDGKPHPVITEDFVLAYLDQTDAKVLDTLRAAGGGSNARDLGERLAKRDLFRRSVNLHLHERTHELGPLTYSNILDEDIMTPDRIHGIEATIADGLSISPHLVAIHIDAWANPTYRQPGGRVTAKDILFQHEEDRPRLLQAESEIFEERVGRQHAYAYLYTPRLKVEEQKKAEELLWTSLTDL